MGGGHMPGLCVGTHGRTMMRTMDKKTVDYDMDLLPDSVLYDIFYESATRLGGAYAARMDRTADPSEQARWLRAQIGLDAQRDAIDPNDRKAQIEVKRRWDAERKALVADDDR